MSAVLTADESRTTALLGRPEASRRSYRPDIDGLRALAVLVVIANHLNTSLLPSGYLGVDMFFVISGYVITGSLWDRRNDRFGDYVAAFYGRRIRRLLPALLVCVVTTSFFIALVATTPAFSLHTALAALLGAANIVLYRWSTDYFAAPTALNAFTHTWSLGVEEQFYVIYPIALWFLLVRRNRPKLLLRAVVFAGLASATIFVVLGGQANGFVFFLLPGRLWEIAVGCALYIARPSVPASLSKRRSVELLSSGGLVVALAAFGADFDRAWFLTILVTASTALVIAWCTPRSYAYRVLASRPLVEIGKRSYSLYLWHWPVFTIWRWSIGITPANAIIPISLTFAISALAYALVEKPFREATWSATPSGILLRGAAASAAAALTILVIDQPLRPYFSAWEARLFPGTYADPGITHATLPCHFPSDIETSVSECLPAVSGAERTIFLLGDSHASNHVHSLQKALDAVGGGTVRYLIEWGFINAVGGHETCVGSSPCIPHGFDKQVQYVRDYAGPGDFVVFAWARDRVVKPGAFPRKVDPSAIVPLESHLKVLIDATLAKGAAMILVDDIPKTCDRDVLFDVDILRLGHLQRCTVPRSLSLQDRQPLSSVYRRLRRRGVFVFDPHDALCSKAVCGLTLGNSSSLLYGDTSPHLALASGITLAPAWTSFLRSAVRDEYLAGGRSATGLANANR